MISIYCINTSNSLCTKCDIGYLLDSSNPPSCGLCVANC